MNDVSNRNGIRWWLITLVCGALSVGWVFSVAAQTEEDGDDAEVSVSGGPVSGDEFTAAGQAGAALPEIFVEAQNQVRQRIRKSSFSFPLDAAAVDSFFTPMDEKVLAVSPVSGLQPHLNNLEHLASNQPPHYWLPEMTSTPVVTFYPQDPEGHRVKSWTLTVTDFRGAPFMRFTGRGEPPASLDWDGRGEHGKMLKVGYPYSYVFSLTDKGTNSYNYAGVSFRIPALVYREGGDRRLELAGGELFTREEDQLTARGRNWLTRAADEIRRFPFSPVKVAVIAETQTLAEQRADVVATYLAASMILPCEQVATEAEQRPDLRAELDGAVTIVIEHAE